MLKLNSLEDYISKYPDWEKIFLRLKTITHKLNMGIEIKWGIHVFTFNGENIAGFAVFKNHAALWFYQGALLKDKYKKLINAQAEKTKALRQWRFVNQNDFLENEKIIEAYIKEAIENSKSGKKILPNKTKEISIPPELQKALKKNKALNESFQKLSLACKREYSEYIAEAKKEETKLKRLEKIIPMILENQGLNDKYKKKF